MPIRSNTCGRRHTYTVKVSTPRQVHYVEEVWPIQAYPMFIRTCTDHAGIPSRLWGFWHLNNYDQHFEKALPDPISSSRHIGPTHAAAKTLFMRPPYIYIYSLPVSVNLPIEIQKNCGRQILSIGNRMNYRSSCECTDTIAYSGRDTNTCSHSRSHASRMIKNDLSPAVR